MVYTGEKDKEEVREYMAMRPERSEQLNNFKFPYLKWGNQRFLRCMKVDSETEASAGAERRIRRRSSPLRFSKSSASITTARRETEQLRQQQEPRSHHRRLEAVPSGSGNGNGGEEGIDEVREKIMLDLREVVDKMKQSILKERALDDAEETEARQNTKAKQQEKHAKKRKEKEKDEPPSVADEVKPWNLRTRRGAASTAPISDAGYSSVNGYSNRGLRIEEKRANHLATRSDTVKSLPLAKENKKRPKFSVALTRKEIEEDFMAMVGRRPPRRPKKRPRNVQKQMDTMFPGLWLTEVTPDSYKVPDSAEHGKR